MQTTADEIPRLREELQHKEVVQGGGRQPRSHFLCSYEPSKPEPVAEQTQPPLPRDLRRIGDFQRTNGNATDIRLVVTWIPLRSSTMSTTPCLASRRPQPWSRGRRREPIPPARRGGSPVPRSHSVSSRSVRRSVPACAGGEAAITLPMWPNRLTGTHRHPPAPDFLRVSFVRDYRRRAVVISGRISLKGGDEVVCPSGCE